MGAGYLAALSQGRSHGTHLPADLDALLEAARQAPAPADYGDEYKSIAPHFDHAYYFGRYPDVARARLDPVAHYIRAGAKTGRDPTPFFSGAAYLARVPEARESKLTPFGHFLANGKSEEAPLYATATDFTALSGMLGQKPSDLLQHLQQRHAELRQRLTEGTLGAMASRAAAFEPLVGDIWHEAFAPRILPFTSPGVLGRILALYDLETAAQWRPAKVVLVTGQLPGPMEARTAALARALAQHLPASEIVVLRTQPGPFDPDLWQTPGPQGMRLIEMPLGETLPLQERPRVIVEFLRALTPDVCILEASGAGSEQVWNLLDMYGKQLSAAMAVVAWLPDTTNTSVDATLSARFYRHFEHIESLWVSSEALRGDLIERFSLSQPEADRLGHLPTLVPDVTPAKAGNDRARWVVGASTGLEARETDRFIAVAEQMPETRFALFFETQGKQRRYKYFPDNLEVFLAGEPGFAEAVAEAEIWLDCGASGAWLVHMAACGTAIVATPEACHTVDLDPALVGCPPANDASPNALAHAVRAALNDPEARQRKATALRHRLNPDARQPAQETTLGTLLNSLEPVPRDIPAPRPASSPLSRPDAPLLTLALTAHGESHVAGPMLQSVEHAIAALKTRLPEAQVEVLVGLDTPQPACLRFFERAAPSHLPDCRILHYTFRDQGQTRTALADEARGRFLAFVDADDLISENWLSSALTLLEEREAEGIDTIVHPEVNWLFDASARIYSNPAQNDPLFSPHVMAIANYYDAMCIAPTRLWHSLAYPHRDLSAGFALEDYQWFVEATDLGWHHAVAPDTIIFKRRRDNSQHRDSRQARALIRAIPALKIDRIKQIGGL